MYHNVSVIVLFALLASAIGSPNREEFQAAKEKCIAETGVNPELVNGPPTKEAFADENVKCFRACLMKQFGVLNEDGTWNMDKVIAKIPEDDLERDTIIAGLTECAAIKGANDCETVHEAMKCIHDKKIPMHRVMGRGGHHKDD